MAEHNNFGAALRHAAGTTALAAGGALALGGALFGYGMLETQKFGLRRETLHVLPRGSHDIKVLHLSDIHMVPGQETKIQWIRELAELQPDFVINTGDNLSHRDGVPSLIKALEPLMAFPGAFVPGSNCYYAPKLKNPFEYFSRSDSSPSPSPKDQ